MMVDESELIYIPEEESDQSPKSILHQGDMVLSKTAYPAASLVTQRIANTSQDTIAVKLKKNGSNITGRYLTVLFKYQIRLSSDAEVVHRQYSGCT